MKTNGFTLIEMLVVIAIIAILAGLVGLNLAQKPAEAKVAAAKMQIKTLQTAVQLYRTAQGVVPTQAQGLRALVEKPTIEPIPPAYPPEGYLDSRRLPKDPWGRDYIYLAPGRNDETFEILCYGSDGEPGGTGDAADISSSEL